MKRAIHTHFELRWWNNTSDGGIINGETPVVEPPAAPFDLEPVVHRLIHPMMYHA
ncbi:MAG TPA: hypothetical protein VK694_06595 [Verrucomicrobiae bacterium]|nr:hypothetical protein [Verrucomicrobiae bacterium]